MANSENVTLEEALDVFIRSKQLELFTMIPGKIIEFDELTQLAKVEITIKRVFANDEEVTLPQIENVPCIVHRTNAMAITTPIKPEDNCLLMFSQRALDTWVFNGNGFIPPHSRLHDKTDCFALVGIYPQGEKIENYHPDNISLRNLVNDNRIEVYPQDQIDLISKQTSIILHSTNGITEYTPGDISVTAEKSISLIAKSKPILIDAQDDTVTINSTNGSVITIEAKANGDIIIKTGGTITLDGEVTITGDLQVNGAINTDSTIDAIGEIASGLIGLTTHKTSGVTPGSGVSLVPVP